MKAGLWKVGFGTRKWGDNFTSVKVIARTGEEAIEKAKKKLDEGEESYYVEYTQMLGRAD
jgi:hypothetical protein